MKPKLRKQFKELRDNLDKSGKAEKLRDNFLREIQLGKNLNIASYYPMKSELDVSLLNLELIDQGHKIYLPHRDGNFRRWELDTLVRKHIYAEPMHGEDINLAKLDYILAPLVAFDENKNRLGYGSGYYDKALPQTNCPKIGIAFEVQKAADIPAEDHDIKLDMIVTEANIYK